MMNNRRGRSRFPEIHLEKNEVRRQEFRSRDHYIIKSVSKTRFLFCIYMRQRRPQVQMFPCGNDSNDTERDCQIKNGKFDRSLDLLSPAASEEDTHPMETQVSSGPTKFEPQTEQRAQWRL